MKKIHEKMSIVLLMLLSLAIVVVGSALIFSLSAQRADVSSTDNGQYQTLATTVSADEDMIRLDSAEFAAAAPSESETSDSSEPASKFANWQIWFLAAVIVIILLIVETLFFVQLTRKPNAQPVEEKQATNLIIINTEEVVHKVEKEVAEEPVTEETPVEAEAAIAEAEPEKD